MAITEVPVLTYADATGVIDSTAAAEVAALGVLILSLIPDTGHSAAQTTPPAGLAPGYDNWPPALANEMRTEIAAALAAIAAAPTS